WSVTAIGQAGEVTDPGERARLETIGLTSWAPGERDHFIRISPVMLNGRHLRTDSTQPAQRSG
ncbi:MAG: pyridoxamine 5'-phosphate oxidase family protein, partial [Streptosporangiaceae bacterium]